MMKNKAPTTSLRVHSTSHKELSPGHKKFNSLIASIAKQRSILVDWDIARSAFVQRMSAEIDPLREQEAQAMYEWVMTLDGFSHVKLAKKDREFFDHYLLEQVQAYLDALDEHSLPEAQTIKRIFERLRGVSYEQEQAWREEEAKRMTQSMAEEMFGTTLTDEELSDPALMEEKLLQAMAEKVQQNQAKLEAEAGAAPKRGRAKSAAPKKPTAKELKAQAHAQQLSQSVKEIYRKLASSLHPDRETAPAERERKTALMQRVNKAYEANNLLELLELQLETEQIDEAHIEGLSDERIKHYCKVLSDQLKELRREVQLHADRAMLDFQLPPFKSYTPKGLLKFLDDEVKQTRRLIHALQLETKNLRSSPELFKTWLKVEKSQQNMLEQEAMIKEALARAMSSYGPGNDFF